MNVLKLFIIAVTGVGFGFTTTQFINTNADTNTDTQTENTDTPYYYGCHSYYGGDEFIETFLSHFSEEDQVLIEAYLDTLLLEEGVTLEDLETDYTLRHDIMYQLHEYVEEQGFEFQYDEDYYPRHGHMGW